MLIRNNSIRNDNVNYKWTKYVYVPMMERECRHVIEGLRTARPSRPDKNNNLCTTPTPSAPPPQSNQIAANAGGSRATAVSHPPIRLTSCLMPQPQPQLSALSSQLSALRCRFSLHVIPSIHSINRITIDGWQEPIRIRVLHARSPPPSHPSTLSWAPLRRCRDNLHCLLHLQPDLLG